jgi:hypothetical protein
MATITAEEMHAMDRAAKHLILIVLFISILGACDNAPPLERATNLQTATLRGTFYTESPDDLVFPVKVLFAIDCSGSMGAAGVGSDPSNRRLTATRAFVDEYNGYPNISFEILLWNQGIYRATQVDGQRGFTKDIGELNGALANVVNTGTTDYVGTIEAINEDIGRDIANTENHDSLVRTKYVVLFFSDGLDNVPGSTEQRVAESLNAVQDIIDMVDEEGVGDFSFHTVMLPGIDMNAQDRQDCRNLLMNMASTGRGRYDELNNAGEIQNTTFIDFLDLRLTAEYQVKFMVAFNFNVVPGVDTIHMDSDGDGLADEVELEPTSPVWPATDPNLADTDGDGLTDFAELKLDNNNRSFDPTEYGTQCEDYRLLNGSMMDTDADGLNDCVEFFKGTNRFHPDTDADGIPDVVEFYSDSNPLENQTTLDSDFDGTINWFEIQRHTNLVANDPKVRQRWAYGYDFVDRGIDPQMMYDNAVANMRRCDFVISNISLLGTSGGTAPDGRTLLPGDNYVKLFVAQVPEDMPDRLPVYRVVDYVFNYSDSVRDITLYPGDFDLLE